MHSVSYGAFDDLLNGGLNHCNRESDLLPLMVNCAGSFSTESTFTTSNKSGRLDYYLLYVVSGKLTVMLPEGYTVCESGSFIFFPPKTEYAYTHKSGDILKYLWVHFTGCDVEEIMQNYGFKTYPSINRIKCDGAIDARFNNLFEGFARQDRFRDRELSLLLERLLISMARRLSDGGMKDNQLRRSIAYVNSRYNTEIKIPELASMENLSVSRYNALFRKIMNCSPTEYITRMRISSARELLFGTDLSISKISLLVGYQDPHFFSRIFKSSTGLSPTEFRRNA